MTTTFREERLKGVKATTESVKEKNRFIRPIFSGFFTIAFVATILPCFLRLASGEAIAFGMISFGSWSSAAFVGGVIGGSLLLFVDSLRFDEGMKAFSLACFGVVFYIGGYVAVLLSDALFVSIVGGFAFGLGVVLLSTVWLLCSIITDFRKILVQIAIAVICAVAIDQIIFLIPEQIGMIFSMLLLVIGAVPPLFMINERKFGMNKRGREADQDGIGEYDGMFPSKPSIGEVLKPLSSSMAGLAIFAIYSNAIQDPFPGFGISGTSFGLFVAGLMIFFVMRFGKKKISSPFIYWVLLPAIAAVLIILDSFPVNSMPFMIGATGITVFCSGLGLFAIAFLLVANQQNHLSPYRAIGLSFMVFSLSGFFGCLLRQSGLSIDERGSFLLVLSTLYMVYLLFTPALQLWKQRKSSPVCSDGSIIESDNIASVCCRLAKLYGISPREEEVLAYVGQGYNSPYIAKALFISDSTVRSHLKSIYRKTNVSSRMELVDMIRRESASQGENEALRDC